MVFGEAELFVEAMRVDAHLVGGELDDATAGVAATLYGPVDHLGAEAGAALVGADMDVFQHAALHAESGHAGNNADLDGADDRAIAFRNDKTVIGIGRD